MFDDLRDLSNGSSVQEDPKEKLFDAEPVKTPEARVFGMTAGQRFFIALLFLATVIVLGFAFLMVFERVWF